MGSIQVRNVPDDVHRTLKSRAAKLGISLSDLVRDELTRSARQTDMKLWLARVAKIPKSPITHDELRRALGREPL